MKRPIIFHLTIKAASSFFSLLLCLALSGQVIFATHAAMPPTFVANNTTFIGSRNTEYGVDEFLGVPFAQPPIEELRWQPAKAIPAKPAGAAAERRVTEYAPACMQGVHISDWYKGVIRSFGGDPDLFVAPEVSEDCLYLNIWAPSGSPKKAFPVMVYLHGGSNKGGWSYEPNYIGARLASEGVVVVSIAYRLGVFGFFSHPELQHANFALTDQIEALAWVKRHIQAVGGDPGNMTVFGESAGASNIAYLMSVPKARGLFQRAVHQSAGWAMWATDSKSNQESLGLELAREAGGDSAGSISHLRSLPSSQLLALADEVYANHFFDVVVDGETVLQPLSIAFRRGDIAPVDLMIGNNANEARMYLPESATFHSLLRDRLPNISESDIQRIIDSLMPDEGRASLEQLDFLATNFDYACPSLLMAREHAQSNANTWYYRFTKVRDGGLAQSMGAYHGAELPYVFGTHDAWLPTSDADHSLTAEMMRRWVSFAAAGNPNHATSPIDWRPYLQRGDAVLSLGAEIRAESHPGEALCQLIEEIKRDQE